MVNWRRILAWVYFLAFMIYIYYRWEGLSLDPAEYISWASSSVLFVTVILLLIESQKWRILMLGEIHMGAALEQVLAGFSTAVFSPGQLGHFMGRKVLHQRLGWWKATGATLLGGFWQTFTFIAFGALGAWWLTLPAENQEVWTFLKYAAILLLLFFLVGLQLIGPLYRWISSKGWSKSRFIQPAVSILAAMKDRSAATHISLFGLSVLKSVLIYAQFAFLLYLATEVALDIKVYWVIPIVFLIITLLPLPSMLGLIARGEIVLQLWKMYDLDAEKAYVCVYALWIFNIMLPAILGALMILIRQKKLNL